MLQDNHKLITVLLIREKLKQVSNYEILDVQVWNKKLNKYTKKIVKDKKNQTKEMRVNLFRNFRGRNESLCWIAWKNLFRMKIICDMMIKNADCVNSD